jgi:UDP-2-acetamido-3-amino-2,3-dideoxy-glucuronate N-acetyltransferase
MPSSYAAHPTAIIEDGARIGPGSRVWHHCHVREGAVVGRECTLGKNVFVDQGAVIGDRVKIQNNVSVYTGVVLGDDVFVGPSAVFTNDRFPRAANSEWQVEDTLVQRGASIGANATVVCGVSLGQLCVVGAAAVVTRSVEAHEVVLGNPARRFGWACACGRVASRNRDRPDVVVCDVCSGRGAQP